MNNDHRLPPRHQLARPSPALGRRMEALFVAGSVRPATTSHSPWPWLAPVGLAAAIALCITHPWHNGPGPGKLAGSETRELPADLAATLCPPTPSETVFSLSIGSY
jgi:hypothetical protein